jgi:spermidine/putrescine transport system permease protein
MRSGVLLRGLTGLYLFLFLSFLFGPLLIMVVTALNSSAFPRISPWDCLSFEWFARLAGDERLQSGLLNSFVIGIAVVVVAVSLGLAGALFLTQIKPSSRAVYYSVVTAPILMPGVVLGISTIIFWDRTAQLLGFNYGSLLYNGIFLTILGQSSFISSYCMLVMISRLQRFDTGQLEAALDLGATNVQAFRRVLLPFLKPAIASAAVIAFLASFENYNTTVFTISHFHTFTTIISQKVRLGVDPSISAVAFVIIALSLIGALFYEGLNRRGELKLQRRLPQGTGLAPFVRGLFASNPATIMGVAVVVAAVAGIWFALGHSADQCKADLLKQKLERQQQLQQRFRRDTTPADGAPSSTPGMRSPGQGTFGDVFSPRNLKGRQGGDTGPATPQQPGQGAFGDVFNPGNLKQQPDPGRQ